MPFLSKTRYPYAIVLNGAEIKQRQDSSAMLSGSYHANGGGFVASTAHVDDTVYVGKNARVLGNAVVKDYAIIDGYATITGSATVSGDAIVTGHAVVAENAEVRDKAVIADYAGVMGRSVVSDNARVIESGLVYDNYKVSGNATVKGVAFCMVNGSATGQAMPDGDYYDDSSRTVQAGSVYGWASPDTYVNSRPYTEKQVAGLEFDKNSSYIADDTYTSTYGAVIGNPEWNETKTSGKGVLTFRDKSQYIIADSSYAMLRNAEYQTAVLLRDNKDENIFTFGNDENRLRLYVRGNDIIVEKKINNDRSSDYQEVVAGNAIKLGEWAVIGVSFCDGEVTIKVNGEIKARENAGIYPIDYVSEDAKYLIADDMNGSMDFFRVNFMNSMLDSSTPDYYYTETETILPSVIGDVNADGKFSVADAVMLQNWLLGAGDIFNWKAGDLIEDNELDVFDMVEMRYLLVSSGLVD